MFFKSPNSSVNAINDPKSADKTSNITTDKTHKTVQGDLFGSPKPMEAKSPVVRKPFTLNKPTIQIDNEDHRPDGVPLVENTTPVEAPLPEVIGKVDRVIYATEDGYAVYSVRTNDNKNISVSVTSPIKCKRGDKVIAKGQWGVYKGKQTFKAVMIMLDIPKGARGVVAWLKMGSVPGVGAASASAIAKYFGDDILDVITKPDELIKAGISEKRAQAISEAWINNASQPELVEFLGRFGLGEMTIAKIIKRYGAAARRVIQNSPWSLADTIDGIGFSTADEIAMDAGHSKESPVRINCGIKVALDTKTGREGHCGLSIDELIVEARRLLGVKKDLIVEGIAKSITAGDIIDDELTGLIYNQNLYAAETKLANRLLAMIKNGPIVSNDIAKVAVETAVDELKVNRDESQVKAAIMAVSNPISIITGGPGTGKSTTQKVIVKALELIDQKTILAAPTGRAAKRLSEASGCDASTCHRLLSFSKEDGGFIHHARNPFPEKRIIIDEFSMVDLRLGESFMDAISIDAAITIVGDVDQLPSVGSGQVLKDLIDSGAIPVTRLKTVHRQTGDSGIVVAAANINEGHHPLNGESSLNGFEVVTDVKCTNSSENVRKTIVDIVANKIKEMGYDPIQDVQVLSPMRQGEVGIIMLNEELKQALNPSNVENTVLIRNKSFSVGDRVMHLRNDYVKNVYNGEVGSIVSVGVKKNEQNHDQSYITVDYSGYKASYTGDDINDVELSWAATVHKSQGCEFPVVVFVCLNDHKHMLTRNLIYTAVTRAKKLCIIVGHEGAIIHAVNTADTNNRSTGLAMRLTS